MKNKEITQKEFEMSMECLRLQIKAIKKLMAELSDIGTPEPSKPQEAITPISDPQTPVVAPPSAPEANPGGVEEYLERDSPVIK